MKRRGSVDVVYYVDKRFEELQAQLDRRLSAYQRETDKYEETVTERLSKVNEFRETLRDQAQHFVTTATLDAREANYRTEIVAMNARVTAIEKYRANMDGRFWALGAGLAFIVAVVNILIYLLGK